MSSEEKIMLFENLEQGIILARKKMLERKAKLGEYVVIADADGMPVSVPASELL